MQTVIPSGPAWLRARLSPVLPLALASMLIALGSAGAEEAPKTPRGLSINAPVKLAAWQQRLTLGPGDTLNFTLYGHPETARTEVPVTPDGKISFLEATDIQAADHTIDELRDLLNAALAKYYLNARTIVTPATIRSKQYFILGKIIDKGAFPLDRPLTIIEAVARSKGLETGLFEQNTVELADLPRAFLIRHGRKMNVDFERLFQQGDLTQNVSLEPDDYLYFPSANVNEIYVCGAVQSPGVEGFTPNATVVSIVTRRGGFSPKAYLDRVLVVRGSMSHPETFVVPVSKVIKGRTPDFPLQPKDIVYVSEKPWQRAEDLADIALRSFVQAAAAGWASHNIGPLITTPIIPNIK